MFNNDSSPQVGQKGWSALANAIGSGKISMVTTTRSFLNIKVHNLVAFLNLLHQKGDESSRKEQGLEVLMGCD